LPLPSSNAVSAEPSRKSSINFYEDSKYPSYPQFINQGENSSYIPPEPDFSILSKANSISKGYAELTDFENFTLLKGKSVFSESVNEEIPSPFTVPKIPQFSMHTEIMQSYEKKQEEIKKEEEKEKNNTRKTDKK